MVIQRECSLRRLHTLKGTPDWDLTGTVPSQAVLSLFLANIDGDRKSKRLDATRTHTKEKSFLSLLELTQADTPPRLIETFYFHTSLRENLYGLRHRKEQA